MGDGGFEPPKALPADLQSVPFGHSGNPPYSLGAGGRIRTPDLLITNQLLYQLSYTSISISAVYSNRTFGVCQHIFYARNEGKSQAKNAVLFQQTILRYFVHFGQHEKATRQSPAGSLCFIALFPCYFRVLCVRFSLKYERTGAARPPPPSTRPAPCSHSARLKPSLGSCSSRFGFA